MIENHNIERCKSRIPKYRKVKDRMKNDRIPKYRLILDRIRKDRT